MCLSDMSLRDGPASDSKYLNGSSGCHKERAYGGKGDSKKIQEGERSRHTVQNDHANAN